MWKKLKEERINTIQNSNQMKADMAIFRQKPFQEQENYQR